MESTLMPDAPKRFDFPLFPHGKHRANDGTIVDLTYETLQDLVRNTNFIIGRGILKHPPVGFRHPAARDRFAKGHIATTEYRNGVAHALVENPKFLEAAKNGDILEYSGEIGYVEYTEEDGAPKKIGPCIVGIGLLGDERAGIKDPRRKPLSQLIKEQAFGESLTPAQTWEIAEELRKAGLMAQTYDAEGNYAFSEINVDPEVFGEPERQEQTMTDEQIQAAIANGIKTATEPLNAKIAEQDAKIKSFSETSKRDAEAKSFCEKYAADRAKKAPLPKLSMDRLEDLLSDPEMTPGTITKLKAFAESLPGAYVAAPKNDDKEPKGKGDDEDDDEPRALAALRPKHFADIGANEGLIDAGLVAFSEFKPDAFKGIEENPAAQLDKLRSYVTTRDTATN